MGRGINSRTDTAPLAVRSFIHFPEWNDTKKTFETREQTFYFQSWEVDTFKKLSSLRHNFLPGRIHYIEDTGLELKMFDGVYYDSLQDGKENIFGSYDASLYGHYIKAIIISLNEKCVVWRNYDWE